MKYFRERQIKTEKLSSSVLINSSFWALATSELVSSFRRRVALETSVDKTKSAWTNTSVAHFLDYHYLSEP